MSALPTIEQLAAQLDTGRSSALALTEAALARARDPAGEGSRVFTQLGAERALAAARASDLLRAVGIKRSPLEGLPVSIKDLFDVSGQVTTAGSAVLRDAEPATENAVVVERLIAAGAVIIGRSNMTEFAFSGLGLNPHYGTPANPWERSQRRIPGGSSSGAAVSVSDAMAVVGIGTDTGGSSRIPAALCGITGFKPTQRRIPLTGSLPLSGSLDSIGPLGASVRCCAITDAILAGDKPQAPACRTVEGIHFAVPDTLVTDGMDPVVSRCFERALATLARQGARITSLQIPEFAQLAELHARGTFAAAESWAWHRKLLGSRADAYDPRVVNRIRAGERINVADYLDLVAARQRWISAVEARIGDYDALLMPTVPVVAPLVETLEQDDQLYNSTNLLMLRNPTLINFLDGCALSVPCHAGDEAPVGLMVAGTANTDHFILALGQGVELALQAA